jgi:hypothetical protein
MKHPALVLIIAASSFLLLCSGCSKISLSKNSNTSASNASSSSPPPLTGDWTITFVYGENAYNSAITFSQQNKQLAGQGTDETTGKTFLVTGTVDGTKVNFTKKYADMDPNRQPVDYSGDLEYENDSEYRGWKMGGHYKTKLNGQMVDDKWVAVPTAAQEVGQAPPPDQDRPPEAPPRDTSSGKPPNISGQWNANYTFNFKKITSKMWLEQDGTAVHGHGVDTNTNEHFTVEKGWYYYPKVHLKCKYVKGKDAAQNRLLEIQAQVGGGPSLSGETNFGGAWQANLIR